MRVGDLVTVKSSHSFPKLFGIVIDVDHDFYKQRCGDFQDRLHIFWQGESISSEPESYVKLVTHAV